MSWGLKGEQEFAAREGKGRPGWEKSRGKGLEEGDQGLGPLLFIGPTYPMLGGVRHPKIRQTCPPQINDLG